FEQDSKENSKPIAEQNEIIAEVKETKPVAASKPIVKESKSIGKETKSVVASKPDIQKDVSKPIISKTEEAVFKKEEPKTSVKPDVQTVAKTGEVKPKANPVAIVSETVKSETPSE